MTLTQAVRMVKRNSPVETLVEMRYVLSILLQDVSHVSAGNAVLFFMDLTDAKLLIVVQQVFTFLTMQNLLVGLPLHQYTNAISSLAPVNTPPPPPSTTTTIITTTARATATTKTTSAPVTMTAPPPPSCFDPAFSHLCDNDPCSEASCPGRTDAECRSNFCECTAEFFSGGQKLANQECDVIVEVPASEFLVWELDVFERVVSET